MDQCSHAYKNVHTRMHTHTHVEILVVGTGSALKRLPPDVTQFILRKGLGLEVQDTVRVCVCVCVCVCVHVASVRMAPMTGPVITICCWTDCVKYENQFCMVGRTQYKSDQASAKADLTK